MRVMRRVVFVACLGAVGCQAPPPAALSTEDHDALNGMFVETAKYFAARNFAEWATQFSEDAVLQPPHAPMLRGRSAIQAYGEGFPVLESISFGEAEIHGEGNLAYGWSSYALKAAGAPADSGKQLVVFRRPPGGPWLVVGVSYNSDLPLPTPVAPESIAP